MATRIKSMPVKTSVGRPSLNSLAKRIRAAHKRTEHGRDEWIEGTMEIAAALAEARERFPSNNEFGKWLDENNLDHLGKNDRAALIKMAADPDTTRRMLMESERVSWQLIWRDKHLPINRNTSELEHQQAVERAQHRKINYVGTDIVGKKVVVPAYVAHETETKVVKLDDHRALNAPSKAAAEPVCKPGKPQDRRDDSSELMAYKDAKDHLDAILRHQNYLRDDFLKAVESARRLAQECLTELQSL